MTDAAGRVGVIGAGTMGAAISALFANASYDVILVDIEKDALKRARIRHEGECLRELEEAGLKKRDEIISKIKYTTEFSELGDCFFVVEAIVERLQSKLELLERLEKIIGDRCIIATNTSSFTPSELSAKLKNPERLVLFHFSNPPILREIVEVGGENVGEEFLQKTVEVAKSIGKEPVILRKDSRGHIFNRFLCSALSALGWDMGKVAPPQVDAAMKNLGSPVGLFELLDYIGMDVLLMVQDSLTEAHGPRFALPPGARWLFEKMIEWGKLGKKSGEGFYKWVEGKAEIPRADPVDILHIVAAAVNEAFRELEEGLTDRETVNIAYKLATASPVGIFDVAEMLGYRTLIDVLEKKFEETGAEVFKPCEMLKKMAEVE
jgi:enoyl-CoA hydratase/3-hydroxyacyl-CoA dehydrogenase